ncbi:MAG: FtsQ-type POTRA domain-containing protein, partial [Thermoanaerobaculia bacterium]|nr:FtsQ-type POTRA domain-containing protein [Thermoanaerobaculia bacterium]
GDRVDVDWVEGALRPVVGRHILGLSLSDISGPLSEHPWVASVEVTKVLPRRLLVSVDERYPVAVWQREDRSDYVDGEGRVIAPTAGEELATLLPRLLWKDGEPVPVAGALALLEELRGLRPAWASLVESLEILADGDFRLEVSEMDYTVMVRPGTLADSLPRLDRALKEIGDESLVVGVVDLRLPRRVVIRPAAATAERSNPAARGSSAATEES